jgi:hypothetical protein
MAILYKAYSGQFTSPSKRQGTGDGRHKAAAAIRKMYRSGPQRPDALIKGRDEPYRSNSVNAIRKALQHPRVIGEAEQVDLSAIAKGLRKSKPAYDYDIVDGRVVGKTLRKAVAPQSANGQWDNVHADTGASNNFRDEQTAKPNTARLGGQLIGTPSKTNMQAAVDAIKEDLARGAKRMGV